MRRVVMFVIAMAVAVAVSVVTPAQQKPDSVTTIKLVQTPGKFETEKLELKPGKYIFEVTNQGIDHEVGFWLRKKTADGKGKPLPNSDAGHLKAGQTGKTGVVVLEPGEYLYSCPLNPTPHYILTVK